MDPISIIVTALATGAAAGLKPTAEKVIKDAYEGIKTLIKRKYDRVDVEALERDPASEARKGLVKEDLEKTDAAQDEELLQQAQTVLDVVRTHAPEAAGAVGVSMEELEAQSLRISKIVASGTGVSVKKAKVSGDVEITDVRAGDPYPKG